MKTYFWVIKAGLIIQPEITIHFLAIQPAITIPRVFITYISVIRVDIPPDIKHRIIITGMYILARIPATQQEEQPEMYL